MTEPALVILAAGRARRYGGVKQLAPVGVNGEAVIDLVAGDAWSAGYRHIVVVINDDTGPAIRDHVAQHWPKSLRASFARQTQALGTVDAVLAARPELDAAAPFAVANADDLYGRAALHALRRHLDNGGHALVSYLLDRAVIGNEAVTRGVCATADGRLVELTERRGVRRTDDGFVVDDGQHPATLAPTTPVSMNLWGFASSVWRLFTDAMARAAATEHAEVLLPVVVGAAVAAGELSVSVLPTADECLGVTHPADLALVQTAVKEQVARGERPATPFEPRE